MRMRLIAFCVVALAAVFAVSAGPAVAAEQGHGSMPGMKGEGSMQGHGMMKMGDKVFAGKVGPWIGEARLSDMKAQMEKAKASGMKMEGTMTQTHHLAIALTDPKTKKAVTEGQGTVMVVGPDKSESKANFMVMEGHFGADVALPKPGKYTFKVAIQSGGQMGTASFRHTVK